MTAIAVQEGAADGATALEPPAVLGTDANAREDVEHATQDNEGPAEEHVPHEDDERVPGTNGLNPSHPLVSRADKKPTRGLFRPGICGEQPRNQRILIRVHMATEPYI